MRDALGLAQCIEQLHRRLRDEILPEIEAHFLMGMTGQQAKVRGAGRRLINEAQVRKYVIDPMLEVLGWDLSTPARMTVEAGVEPVAADDSRRFLDYFGRTTNGSERALLLVEAKRLSVALPPSAGRSAKEGVIDAVISAFGSSSVSASAAWKDILTTLADYVNRLDATGFGSPKRVLLTNGEWFVVFLDPRRCFIDGAIAPQDLIVAADSADAVAQAQELFSSLSFALLADEVPPQNCADIVRFAGTTSERLQASLAVEVNKGELGGSRPVMSLHPVVIVRMPAGAWIQFRNPSLEHRVLRKDEELEADMATVRDGAEALLGELRAQCTIDLVSADAFEAATTRIPKFPDTVLLRREGRSDRYLLSLGAVATPFLHDTEYGSCPYHAHGHAHSEGKAASSSPILARSSNPAAYFPSGSALHCSHALVHARRVNVCPIRMLEDFLCCRACALQTRCWPDGLSEFPCRKE